MNKWIAQKKLLFCKKGEGDRHPLTIKVGAPFVDEKGISKCPMEWQGLFEDFADIAGADSVHALHLATDTDSLIRKLQNKYDFFWETGEPYFED